MKKTVLYGVLNWGLGHATRSIPIIQSLLRLGYEPVICSDGDAMSLLRKEFPDLQFVDLPPYHIRYKHRSMVVNVSIYGLGILKTIYKEEKIIQDLVQQFDPVYVISDNRYGFSHPEVKSVMITHQLRIPAPTKWQSKAASNFLHRYIENFDFCWVPDTEHMPNLSGNLSHDVQLDIPIAYIGPLSRFSKSSSTNKYDIAFVLSGPEPQRTYLEKLIVEQWPSQELECVLVRGTAAPINPDSLVNYEQIEYYDLLGSEHLQTIISESNMIVSRAGYTTIMDLVAMEKAAILIPTPGQLEQEYLAEHLAGQFSSIQFATQDEFQLSMLVTMMTIVSDRHSLIDWSDEKLQNLLERLS